MYIWKALVLLPVGLSLACSNSSLQEADLKPLVVAMIEEGWNLGDVEVFSSTIAEDVLFHYAGSPREMSREEMAATVLRWREAFPDLEMKIEALIQERNLVAARLEFSGTHEGSWRGASPTGREVTMALMMFFRFENGRLVELWESDDQLGFRQQLGLGQ